MYYFKISNDGSTRKWLKTQFKMQFHNELSIYPNRTLIKIYKLQNTHKDTEELQLNYNYLHQKSNVAAERVVC